MSVMCNSWKSINNAEKIVLLYIKMCSMYLVGVFVFCVFLNLSVLWRHRRCLDPLLVTQRKQSSFSRPCLDQVKLPSSHPSPHPCSLVQFSLTSHCLSWQKHTHTQQHTQMFLGVCVCGCVFYHMVTRLVCVTVRLLSSGSWSPCDSESCGFRSSKTMSGQLSSQSDFTRSNTFVFVHLSCQTAQWFITFQQKGK